MVHTGTFFRQQRRWTVVVFITGIVLLLFVIWSWWHFVYSNPERTFFAALDNSLRTSDVSKRVTQKTSGQELTQTIALNLSPAHVARADATITQKVETNTTVETQSIGTPKEDYVSYTAIQTDQKGKSGKELDFSKLLNVWGKKPSPDQTQTTGELYGESVLNVVPFGDLPASDREKFIEFVRKNNVFEFDESKVTRKLKGGRPVYTYDVTVAAAPYIGMLKEYAKAAGLTQLESIDPATYRDAQAVDIKITVDVWSRQVTEISYANGERVERFGSYGVIHETTLPKDTIPVEELQKRLQAIE